MVNQSETFILNYLFSKDLDRIVTILYGTDGNDPSHEDISKLATEIYGSNLLSGIRSN